MAAINYVGLHEAIDVGAHLTDEKKYERAAQVYAMVQAQAQVEIARQLTRIADALEKQNKLAVLGPDPEERWRSNLNS